MYLFLAAVLLWAQGLSVLLIWLVRVPTKKLAGLAPLQGRWLRWFLAGMVVLGPWSCIGMLVIHLFRR